MIRIRNITSSISWAIFSVIPMICAQNATVSEAQPISQPAPLIQELPLVFQRSVGALLTESVPPPVALTKVQDLSWYREFQFGMDLQTIAKKTGMRLSDVNLIHERPEVIQEMQWRPQLYLGGSSFRTDPVQEVLFTFYNGKLFRIVVSYDPSRTEGLTNDDMIEAISAQYGTATRPVAKTIVISSSRVYNDSAKVIALWEDSKYSFNFFLSSYQPTLGLVGFSKHLDTLARAAVAEAIRLDEIEAPQREIERQNKQDETDRAEGIKARLANRPNFRP